MFELADGKAGYQRARVAAYVEAYRLRQACTKLYNRELDAQRTGRAGRSWLLDPVEDDDDD